MRGAQSIAAFHGGRKKSKKKGGQQTAFCLLLSIISRFRVFS